MMSLSESLENFNETKKTSIADVVFWIVAALLLVALVLVNVFSFSLVSGESMLNTISDGDIVVCATYAEVKRDDIVTAKVSDDKIIIKRVVAAPGDKIVFYKSGTINDAVLLLIYEDGEFKPIKEASDSGAMVGLSCIVQTKFLSGEYKLYSGDVTSISEEYVISLGKDEYFLLGDNRNNSTDSRSYGAFSKSAILGKVTRVVKPDTILYKMLNGFLFSKKTTE